ncbi:YceD family protein [Corynebacterium vitaeruminis]|uniref:Metal-binding, possibly nucleic acid-binding protein n=1 Tax=Corynebacterium vitaeruminis DSM 20294 TaxID=1224164 RepID=W5Y2F1_9CORY|nr:YceD family protein [Corynebacterium vitaeruminis]AHI23109.1 hypothetical protein B843_08620 [Corynebacterium vitaeruminis DSM 20294]
MSQETSPFVFDVGALLRSGIPEVKTQEGPSPVRIGPAMIAIPESAPVTVHATLTSLGDAVMVDAQVTATLEGECVRCLKRLNPATEISVNAVFAASEDFITGDEAGEDEDELPMVVDDHIDLLQTVIDEAGLTLPFNPTCEGGCEGDGDVPEPDGVSGEEERTDPRWAGLEKFL